MKKVVILYDEDDWNQKKPYKKNNPYGHCYEYLYTLAEKKGIKFFRAYIRWYAGNKIFSKAWTYDIKKKKWIKVKNIKADFCEDKISPKPELKKLKLKIEKEVGMMNSVKMSYAVNNKWRVARIFKKISPKTFLIKNKFDLKKYISKIKTNKMVLKPIIGSGGEGILILEKNKPAKKELSIKNYIMQEFIDTSKGIPELIDSIHDLRMVIINGKIIYSYLRIPEGGSLLSNVHQGGRMIDIKNSQIPKKALKIFKKVDKKLKKFKPRLYTVDVFFKNKKAYLVEINTMPGILFNKDAKKIQTKFYNAIIDTLKKAENKSK